MSAGPGSMPYDDTVRAIVRCRAIRLAGQARLGARGREDAQQEMLLALTRRWPAYDPARGNPAAFVCVVTGRAAADLARRARAKKRAPPGLVSLDAVPEEARDTRSVARPAVVAEGRRDLALDTARILAGLPSGLLRLARSLMEEGTLTGAARRLGVPWTSLLLPLRRLRDRFERAGLRDYL